MGSDVDGAFVDDEIARNLKLENLFSDAEMLLKELAESETVWGVMDKPEDAYVKGVMIGNKYLEARTLTENRAHLLTPVEQVCIGGITCCSEEYYLSVLLGLINLGWPDAEVVFGDY